jgi:hypothetical protein
MTSNMTRIIVRLGMLSGAAFALSREGLPTDADACVACLTDYHCLEVSGGATACVPGPNGTCKPQGPVCS